MNETFDFDDILIVPKIKSHIMSRYSGINLARQLPLFTAPMDTVVNLNNMDVFIDNGINVTLPRTIEYNYFLEHHNKKFNNQKSLNPYYSNTFISVGFTELDEFYKNNFKIFLKNSNVLIDVANGHIQRIMDYARELKRLRPDIKIMVGNIANPKTYSWYAAGDCVDYIRVGIGNGCFIAGSKVTTKIGVKNIEDIIIGDEVLTHSGEYKLVASTKKRDYDGDLIKINDIVCTPNHEFYVLNKKYRDVINDENITNFCEWISAKELSKSNEYLLIEIDTDYENDIKF